MAVIQKRRKSFRKSFLQTPLPDLVEIQYNSYKDFLQDDVEPQNRKNIGLQNVFSSMFPIKDYAGVADLEFVEYTLDKPVYNVKECMLRNLTYSSKLKLKLKLILWDITEDGKKTLRDIKEQEIFMGDVPLMTERGSFIAAGVERVIVSQMHRAQGVVFATTKEAKIAGNPITYTARIIPEHGSWIDFEEYKGVIYVRIDRRRKIPATVLLRCLPAAEDEKKWLADPRKAIVKGMSDTEILGAFYKRMPLSFDGKLWVGEISVFEGLDKYRLNYDLINPKDKKPLANKGDRMNAKRLAKIMAASKQYGIMPDALVGEYLFDPIMNGEEVLFPAGTEITEEILADIEKLDIKNISDYYESDVFDIVVSNPPYFKYDCDSKINENEVKSIARHEICINIDGLLAVSKKILKNKGSLYLIHRTERFIEIMSKLRKNNLEPKRVQFIFPKKEKDSNLFLVEAVKNGNSSLKIESPLIIHNKDGAYTKKIIELFGGSNDTKEL